MPPLLAAAILGFAAGLRTFVPIAGLCLAGVAGWLGDPGGGFRGAARSPLAAALFGLAALGELYNDKRPTTGSRLAPISLALRFAGGALSGAIVSGAAGMLLGGSVAIAGAFAGRRFRGAAARLTGGRDLPAALTEDATAIALVVLVLLGRRG